MAVDIIKVGGSANDGTGDTLRAGGQRLNKVFQVDDQDNPHNLQALIDISRGDTTYSSASIAAATSGFEIDANGGSLILASAGNSVTVTSAPDGGNLNLSAGGDVMLSSYPGASVTIASLSGTLVNFDTGSDVINFEVGEVHIGAGVDFYIDDILDTEIPFCDGGFLNSSSGFTFDVAYGRLTIPNSPHFKFANNATYAIPSGRIDQQYGDAANSGITETVLYSKVLPAYSLASSGWSVFQFHAFTLEADDPASPRIRAYFDSTVLFDSGLLVISDNTDCTVKITIYRSASGDAKCNVEVSSNGVMSVTNKYTTFAVANWALSHTLKLTGQMSSAIGNAIVHHFGYTDIIPPFN